MADTAYAVSRAEHPEHRVLLIRFADPGDARGAFADAKHLHGMRQAAILERAADGELDVPDNHVRGAGVPTVGTGVVGGLLGALGGPLGALIGWAAGTALGGYAEERNAKDDGAALIVLGARVAEGTALLVLDIHEADPQPADELAAAHRGTVERLSAHAFAAQVKAAEDRAERAADSDAGSASASEDGAGAGGASG